MSIYQSSVDDNDTSIIYSGTGWQLVTQDLEWRGTMHSTSVTGSWARFRFTGSRVAVICTIPTGDGSLSQARFKIDDGNDQYAAHRTTPPVQWQTTFWDSGPLPMGSHLLTITNAGNEAYFRMDRIDFDSTDSNAPATTSNTPSQGTVTVVQPPNTSSFPSGTTALSNTGSPSANSTGSSIASTNTLSLPSTLVASTTNTLATIGSATPGTRNDAFAPSSSSPSLTAILAGVFAGLFLIVLGVLIAYFVRQRRRNRSAKDKEELFAAAFPPTSRSRLEPSFLSPGPMDLDTGSHGVLPPRSTYHEGASTSFSMYTDVPLSQSDTSESRE